MDPSEIREELIPEIEGALAFIAAGYPIRDLGEELERLSSWFQALAISYLLKTANPERFRESLVRSAHARRYYLRRCREEGVQDDRRLALSRTEAFLDATASGQLALARELAHLSAREYRSGWEYEDDFCYRAILQGIVQSAADTELQELLTRFQQSLQGAASPRMSVCAALLRRDLDALRSALSDLLDRIREECDEHRQRSVERDPESAVGWARAFVSVEGLAILRIAAALDLDLLAVGEEFPMCPALTLEPVSPREYEDLFQGIDRELARRRG